MSLVFFSKLGVFPNNVSCRFLYTLLLCCRNSRKWGCWYQRNDHILSLTFVSYDVLFSKIILNVCGVYICLTREKNVWRYLLWWPHVYVFAKLNGRCAFETLPSSLCVILSLNMIAKRFEWILITFFRSIDWGHVNYPLFSHYYFYQGLQFNDLLVIN